MPGEIIVFVPLAQDQAITLLLQAAEALQHQVVTFDIGLGRAEIHADFSLRALATFRIHAQATRHEPARTRLQLKVRPASRLSPWTGTGQSERVAWQLVGKMQEITDPTRYRRLEDDVVPSPRDGTEDEAAS